MSRDARWAYHKQAGEHKNILAILERRSRHQSAAKIEEARRGIGVRSAQITIKM